MSSHSSTGMEGRVVDGRIEIVAKIGSGGVGSIYEATHRLLGRPVALKLIEVEDATARERLRNEARAISQINSPNVVALVDFGFDEGLQMPYLAMELVDGVPLDKLPAPMSWRGVADLANQLLSAIDCAHAAGVIHRDLKPANIVIAPRQGGGRIVKVLDFGVSRLVSLDARMTRTGELIGTPAYMAPEQIQSDQIDGRVDLWSAGVILYELLTGRRPFEGDQPIAVFRRILKEEPPPLDELVPSAAPLAPVVHRALAKDPDQRFSSAAEMLDALASATALPAPAHQRQRSTAAMPHATPKAPASSRPTLGGSWRRLLIVLVVGITAVSLGLLTAPSAPNGDRELVRLIGLVPQHDADRRAVEAAMRPWVDMFDGKEGPPVFGQNDALTVVHGPGTVHATSCDPKIGLTELFARGLYEKSAEFSMHGFQSGSVVAVEIKSRLKPVFKPTEGPPKPTPERRSFWIGTIEGETLDLWERETTAPFSQISRDRPPTGELPSPLRLVALRPVPCVFRQWPIRVRPGPPAPPPPSYSELEPRRAELFERLRGLANPVGCSTTSDCHVVWFAAVCGSDAKALVYAKPAVDLRALRETANSLKYIVLRMRADKRPKCDPASRGPAIEPACVVGRCIDKSGRFRGFTWRD